MRSQHTWRAFTSDGNADKCIVVPLACTPLPYLSPIDFWISWITVMWTGNDLPWQRAGFNASIAIRGGWWPLWISSSLSIRLHLFFFCPLLHCPFCECWEGATNSSGGSKVKTSNWRYCTSCMLFMITTWSIPLSLGICMLWQLGMDHRVLKERLAGSISITGQRSFLCLSDSRWCLHTDGAFLKSPSQGISGLQTQEYAFGLGKYNTVRSIVTEDLADEVSLPICDSASQTITLWTHDQCQLKFRTTVTQHISQDSDDLTQHDILHG